MSRASRVPRRTYPSDLSGQWRALQNDPLLARFAASRERLACDPYRPLYHFTSPENALNDPNGLCFWQGRWHLFYQGYPPEDPRQHWGHAVSDDLIHWQDLPYAIYPDPEECCFSGATLVEPDRVLAMYHGTECGNMLAVSDDPLLLRWRKLTGGPVIPMRSADGVPLPYSVFDPCIWKKGEAYYALSGGTLPHPVTGRRTRAEFLFRSEDLVHWTYLHPFLEGDGFGRPGDDGACPYFWPLGERHLLLHFSHMSGGKYLIGDYDRDRDVFRVCNGGSFNSGSWYAGGVHAPSAAPDGQGGVIAIWNLNVGKPTPGWDQVMSLPRRLTLTGAYRDELAIEPAGNTDALRTAHVHVGETALPAGREVVLDGVEGDALELRAVFDPRNVPALELNVLRAPDRQEVTRILFYRQRGNTNWEMFDAMGWTGAHDSLLAVDATCASQLPDVETRAPETAALFVAPDEPLELRVFLDRSVLEVFANGRQCISQRVYPGRPDSRGVSVRSLGQDSRLLSLDAWRMQAIFPNLNDGGNPA